MYELIPAASGYLLGVICFLVLAGMQRRWAMGAGCLIIGAAVAAASGELAESPLFILVDGAVALLGAALGAVTVRTMRRRRRSSQA